MIHMRHMNNIVVTKEYIKSDGPSQIHAIDKNNSKLESRKCCSVGNQNEIVHVSNRFCDLRWHWCNRATVYGPLHKRSSLDAVGFLHPDVPRHHCEGDVTDYRQLFICSEGLLGVQLREIGSEILSQFYHNKFLWQFNLFAHSTTEFCFTLSIESNIVQIVQLCAIHISFHIEIMRRTSAKELSARRTSGEYCQVLLSEIVSV